MELPSWRSDAGLGAVRCAAVNLGGGIEARGPSRSARCPGPGPRRAVRRAVGGSRIYILGRRTVGCRAALVGNLLGVPIGDNAFAREPWTQSYHKPVRLVIFFNIVRFVTRVYEIAR